ncbi:hypothetical protein AB1Y20_002888 [Prymnesium parvum]|uniref:Neurotransmitter-gated ion-channel ligand-binding domain-containing protein n=1 Tax=Prymnesium parvum TaxID=97485 RepID=A0AB34JAE4_PRYPA
MRGRLSSAPLPHAFWLPLLLARTLAQSPCDCFTEGWADWSRFEPLVRVLSPDCQRFLAAHPSCLSHAGAAFCAAAIAPFERGATEPLTTYYTLHLLWAAALHAEGSCTDVTWLQSIEASSEHVSTWSKETLGAIFFYYGSASFGVDLTTTPRAHQLLRNQSIDGLTFLFLGAESFQRIGFDVGSSERIVRERAVFLQSLKWPATDVYDLGTRQRVPSGEPPMNISTLFVLQELNDVDELGFTFEVTFLVAMSWTDNRIFSTCDAAGIGGFSEHDSCQFFFQPSVEWSNVVLDPHPEAKSVPKVISSFGITTVGNQAGIGWILRQRFEASFQFVQFPYDVQNLTISMVAAYNLPVDKMRLSSSVEKDDPEPPGTWHPLFDVVAISSEDSDVTLARLNVGGLQADSLRISKSEITIQIARRSLYFVSNFIIIIAILVCLSFLTFLLSAEALESRLSLALTIVLGLNVYQIVVVSSMPQTGYLTYMHTYTIFATALVCLVALENMVSHLAWKRAEEIKELCSFVQQFKNSPVAQRAATVLQVAWRRHKQRPSAKLDSVIAAGRARTSQLWMDSLLFKYQFRRRVFDPIALFCANYLDYISVVGFPCVFAVVSVTIFKGLLT